MSLFSIAVLVGCPPETSAPAPETPPVPAAAEVEVPRIPAVAGRIVRLEDGTCERRYPVDCHEGGAECVGGPPGAVPCTAAASPVQ